MKFAMPRMGVFALSGNLILSQGVAITNSAEDQSGRILSSGNGILSLPAIYIKLVLALSLGLMLIGGAAAQAQERDEDKPQPRLEVSESTHDAGPARAGTSVRHEFIVRNTGEADLKILRIKPGCGCTVVNYPRVIPAGREGRVTMKVKLSDQWAGERIRQASVMETNDPKARLTSLAITALVTAE